MVMLNKFRNSTLIIILIALTAIAVAMHVFSRLGKNTFNPDIVEIDSALVSAIEYQLKNDTTKYKILKDNGKWWVKTSQFTSQCDTNSLANTISQLASLKALRVAAKTPDKWKDFQLDDSNATHVLVFSGKEIMAEIYFGKFSYQQSQNPYDQQGGQMTTYVRIGDDEAIYAVDGFFSFLFQKGATNFRYKKLVDVAISDISSLQFMYPADTSYILERVNNKWYIGEQLVDSLTINKYLNGLSYLNGNEFMDSNKPDNQKVPLYAVKIVSEQAKPLIIRAFEYPKSGQFVVNSTAIEHEFFFDKDKQQIINRLFKAKDYFLKP